MKNILKTISILFVVSTLFSVVACDNLSQDKKAKYVFYFIGDGMGIAQVSMAEAYLATQRGVIANDPLVFTGFPVIGLTTTYSANSFVTCSSASGTALSTGTKTNNGMLGVTPDTTNLESISYKIHDAGYKVGIISDVTINHATPAAFYANAASRNNYYDIAIQLHKTGFDFFGGGGFGSPEGKNKDQRSAYDITTEGGYMITYGLEDFNSKKENSEKIILFQEKEKRDEILPYNIERKEGDLALKDVVKSAIDFLENEKGFFIFAECGKIDWAGHSNDAKTNILEVLNLNDAVEVAKHFYDKYPEETLIIVTSDHETGGMALGKKGYKLELQNLAQQKVLKTKKNAKEIEQLEIDANIGWTTGGHTGVAIPIYAIGQGSQLFSGRMDNTDVPKKVCEAMGVKF